MTSSSAVRTNRSQIDGAIVFMMAKPLAVEVAQRVWHINVNWYNTIENFERFRHVDCVECEKKRVCFGCVMIFFNFKTFASSHALFSKVINNLFFFFALDHPVSDDSFRGIQTMVL